MDMGWMETTLNKIGYELYVKPVESIVDKATGEQIYEKYPWIFRAYIKKRATRSKLQLHNYKIGIIGGLGISFGREPEPHARYKINRLGVKLYDGFLDLGIVNTWGRMEANREDLLKIGFPEDKIYESRAMGHIPHLFNDKKIVKRLKRNGVIP